MILRTHFGGLIAPGAKDPDIIIADQLGPKNQLVQVLCVGTPSQKAHMNHQHLPSWCN